MVASKEGLEAFAPYWYETANYGYETGELALTKSVSSPDCKTCINYYEVVQAGYIEDDWMAESEIEVIGVHSDFVLTPEGRYQALVHFRQEAMEYYGPEGLQDKGEPDRNAVHLFEAVWIEDHWVAVNIVTMQTPGICMVNPTGDSC